MMKTEYKVSGAGWLCVRTGRGDVYGWTPVCKLTEKQLAELREVCGL